MKLIWKAACAAVLIALMFIEIGCGGTYRPIANPLPVTTGNPSGAETEVVLNQGPTGGSVLTDINVSGDSNAGNKVVANPATALAFDYNRTTVYTANTNSDSVTQVSLLTSTAGFAANTTTISLDSGSKPIGISFQYFGTTYTTEYVVNSGGTALCPSGSVTAITQASDVVKANICLSTTPVFAWIYTDQSKVFVLDNENHVYVVSASKYKVTNTLTVGTTPIKATQSTDGQYVYVLNGSGTISIIDGTAESVVNSVNIAANSGSVAAPIDIEQDTTHNRIWVLQSDGTVSVYDAATPGALNWITSLSTITTPAQTNAGAYATNLAVMRDGTWAYVGLGATDQIVGIDASKLASNAPTTAAITPITVGNHRSLTSTYTNTNGLKYTVTENTTPIVTKIAVSRGGNSADLAKVYATTITNTTYTYFDANGAALAPPVTPSWCSLTGTTGNQLTCANLFNGTSVVTAAANTSTPINTYVLTVPAPSQVTYCDPGNGVPDGQLNCPVMVPLGVVGRS